MRTSLDALLATNASVSILKCRVLMPQESHLADYILWALFYTLPASHTMAWIHRYKLSQKRLHVYLSFLTAKLRVSTENTDRQNEVRLGLIKDFLPKCHRANAYSL